MVWTPIILLALFVTATVFVGAAVGALRVRHFVASRRRFGRFALAGIIIYYALLLLAFGFSYWMVESEHMKGIDLAAASCLVFVSGPALGIYLAIKAGEHLYPDSEFCDACGYDMRGSPTHVCPECGRKQPSLDS